MELPYTFDVLDGVRRESTLATLAAELTLNKQQAQELLSCKTILTKLIRIDSVENGSTLIDEIEEQVRLPLLRLSEYAKNKESNTVSIIDSTIVLAQLIRNELKSSKKISDIKTYANKALEQLMSIRVKVDELTMPVALRLEKNRPRNIHLSPCHQLESDALWENEKFQ